MSYPIPTYFIQLIGSFELRQELIDKTAQLLAADVIPPGKGVVIGASSQMSLDRTSLRVFTPCFYSVDVRDERSFEQITHRALLCAKQAEKYAHVIVVYTAEPQYAAELSAFITHCNRPLTVVKSWTHGQRQERKVNDV